MALEARRRSNPGAQPVGSSTLLMRCMPAIFADLAFCTPVKQRRN